MLNLKAQHPNVQQNFNEGLHEGLHATDGAIVWGQVFDLTQVLMRSLKVSKWRLGVGGGVTEGGNINTYCGYY